MNYRILLFTILIFFIAVASYKVTHAFFISSQIIGGNTITTAFISPTPTTTPTSTLTPTPSITNNLVINEVYYDPDSNHMQGQNPDENDFEWIEIYNPTGSTVNLKDWKIVENSGSEKSISTSNRNLAAGEFVILAKAANVKAVWDIPADKFISIGENFGNGLANAGDRVILKNDQGTIIDSISYGDDTSQLNPSATDVSEGHSLERDPDGTDTNTNADFVDRTTPTPGS